ncbi:DUF5677 domain-containing protein [Vibrio splendidus]|uniref:DUF5677 domain-containing protein n=1 Tax=Vibrio splendidus TaxID=29497 RepID=UPI00352D87D7
MNYLSEFRKRRGFDKKHALIDIQVALETAAEAFEVASQLNASVSTNCEKEALIRNTHYVLLNRTYQHIEGMLTCVASGAFSSSEALGRVVNESSINLMFMVLKGDERTITAHFARWYKEHTDQLSKWKDYLKGKEHEEKVSQLIDSRIRTLEICKQYTESLRETYSVEEKELNNLWYNSIQKRFLELGRFEEYVEVYHRLSGASHVTAEDTILSVLSLGLPEGFHKLKDHELNSYSIMMSRVVIRTFLDATVCFCVRNGLDNETQFERFLQLRSAIDRSVKEIASDAGVPAKNEKDSVARIEELKLRFGVDF